LEIRSGKGWRIEMEEIGEMIGKGFGIWRQNLNLCIPFLLNFFVSILVAIPFLVVIFMAAMPLASMDSTSIQNVQNPQDMQILFSQMEESLGSLGWREILPVGFLLLGMIVVLSIVGAFFAAGAIGMARQALVEGRAETGAMWSAGRKHFLNMFLSSLLMGLMTMAGLVLLLPGILSLSWPMQADPAAMGMLILGFLMFILYALILSLVLAAAPYALVLEGLGPVRAIRAGIDFFRINKFDVLILWLVVAALSIALQMIGGSLSAGDTFNNPALPLVTGLVNLLILVPLSNLWWTRLYMNRIGMLKSDEVKDLW
jgi:hypothetical protein